MKKTFKNPIFTFIIGVIICGTTCVIADNLTADKITYSPNDKSWGVTNVEAAINSLQLSKTSDNYSTTEKVIGTWIDGSSIYQKTISLGNLPNNTTSCTATGITGLKNVINIYGIAIKSEYTLTLPYRGGPGASTDGVDVYYQSSNNSICLQTAADKSSYNTSYVTVVYTKN